MLNLPVHPGSPEVFSWIRVAQSSLSFCIVFCRSLFVIFLLSIVSTPIYGFRLPLWYHQTFHCLYSYLRLLITPLHCLYSYLRLLITPLHCLYSYLRLLIPFGIIKLFLHVNVFECILNDLSLEKKNMVQ